MENGNRWAITWLLIYLVPLCVVSVGFGLADRVVGILIFVIGYLAIGINFVIEMEYDDNSLRHYKLVAIFLWAPMLISDRFLMWIARKL